MKPISLFVVLVMVSVKVVAAFNVTLEDGSVYYGEIGPDDLPVGEGKLLYPNGDIYE